MTTATIDATLHDAIREVLGADAPEWVEMPLEDRLAIMTRIVQRIRANTDAEVDRDDLLTWVEQETAKLEREIAKLRARLETAS